MRRFLFQQGLLTIALLLLGCFPSREATRVDPKKFARSDTTNRLTPRVIQVPSPTKVILTDAAIILFPQGLTADETSVRGLGELHPLTGPPSGIHQIVIPLDSILAVTTYNQGSNAGSVVASFLHGVLGTVMAPLSVYCVSCPKCCFGSCPTVYTYDGTRYNLEAELFSHCIARQLEEGDIDFLPPPILENGLYRIRVANEALETHYINSLSLFALYHPKGTTILASNHGTPVMVGHIVGPNKATDRAGHDILSSVRSKDDRWYRTPEEMFLPLVQGETRDWIDVHARLTPGRKKVTMVLRLRNTLLSTVLLYDVVLASQNIEAINWINRMDEDSEYASQFKEVYKKFSGVTITAHGDDGTIAEELISDVGPLAWKTIAVEIPAAESGEVSVRLQFIPDNIMIDMIGFEAEASGSDSFLIEEVPPSDIRDDRGISRGEICSLISNDDSQYMVTNPGESFHISYDIPVKIGYDVTPIVKSRGYYHEWVRGQWLREQSALSPFRLDEVQRTFSMLVNAWMQNKTLVEQKFFESRIPLREVP